MTGTDKTGDRLVASIRKTKAGQAPGTTARTRRKAADAPAKHKQTAQVPLDPYQRGRRVWPD